MLHARVFISLITEIHVPCLPGAHALANLLSCPFFIHHGRFRTPTPTAPKFQHVLSARRKMLKADYNRAVALCKASIDGGFDLTTSHTSAERLPFDAVQSLRRQMFSRYNLYTLAGALFVSSRGKGDLWAGLDVLYQYGSVQGLPTNVAWGSGYESTGDGMHRYSSTPC